MTLTSPHPSHDRVRDALRGAAAGLDLHTPDPASVRSTAQHRARRQQRVTAGIASIAVVAGAVGITGLVNREPQVELERGGDVATSPSSAVGSSPSGIEFTWVDGEHALAAQPQIVQGADGVLYALSTAPGVTYEDAEDGQPLPQAVYTSEDGLSWQATELDPDLHLATLHVREDGVLYALSTAPGSAALQVATSADGGSSWQVQDLPATAPPPAVAEGVTLASGGSQMDIATSASTTVVTMQRQWWVESTGLVSPEEAEHTWLTPTEEGLEVQTDRNPSNRPDLAPTPTPASADDPDAPPLAPADDPAAPPPAPADGSAAPPPAIPAHADDIAQAEEAEALAAEAAGTTVAPTPTDGQTEPGEVYEDYEPLVLRTIPWAEIGLEGPEDLVVSQTFTAVDGGEWTPVDLPVEGATAKVEATTEGFLAVIHDQGFNYDEPTPVHVARSADGLDWTLDDAPMGQASYVSDVGAIGDRIVVASAAAVMAPEYRETFTVASSGDAGRTWTATDLTGLVPVADDLVSYVGARDIGPLGVAAVIGAFRPDSDDGHQDNTLLFSPDGVSWDQIPGEDLGAVGTGISWLSVDADRIIASVFQADQSVRTVVGVPTR